MKNREPHQIPNSPKTPPASSANKTISPYFYAVQSSGPSIQSLYCDRLISKSLAAAVIPESKLSQEWSFAYAFEI